MKLKLPIVLLAYGLGCLGLHGIVHGAGFGGAQEPHPDVQGKASFTRSLGELEVTPSQKFPLLIRISTAPMGRPGQLVAGHEIPLLEARLVPASGTGATARTPDGSTIFLTRKDPKGNWRSAQGWKASQKDKKITLEKDGQVISYQGGKILTWQPAEAQIIHWKYTSGKLTALHDAEGKTLLKIERSPTSLSLSQPPAEEADTPRVAEIHWKMHSIQSPPKAKKAKAAKPPKKAKGKKKTAPNALTRPLLTSYTTLAGQKIQIKRTMEKGEVSEIWQTANGSQLLSYAYNATTGAMTQNGQDTITVTHINGFDTPEVARTHEGKKEVLHHATAQSAAGNKKRFADGTTEQKHYIYTQQGRRLGKVTHTINGKTTTIYQAYWKINGDLIKDQRGNFRREYKDGKFHVYENNQLIRTY